MASDEAWRGSFVENAIAFLSQYFDVSEPRVVLNCEQACQWAGKCYYTACYQPWVNKISFKSGSERGYIVAHEFGHRLERAGVIENGEMAAIEMESWWMENVNELACSVCGAPLFVADDVPLGSEVECGACGSVFEAVYRHGRPEGAAGFKLGFVVGLGVGAIIFTAVGREMVKTAAGITESELRRRIEAARAGRL